MSQAYVRIDSTHVLIKTPNGKGQDYFNYKQSYSSNVQAASDHRGYLMGIEFRWLGSCYDAKVYTNSSINKAIQDHKFPLLFKQILPNEENILDFVFGDPAYPLTVYCIKEFKSCKAHVQVIFNSILCFAGSSIEYSLSRLKARGQFWRKESTLIRKVY